LRRIGIAGWKIELFSRRTVLADRHGVIAAIWNRVRVRGHAAEVLTAAMALEHA
jgi:peroxiredoxin